MLIVILKQNIDRFASKPRNYFVECSEETQFELIDILSRFNVFKLVDLDKVRF